MCYEYRSVGGSCTRDESETKILLGSRRSDIGMLTKRVGRNRTISDRGSGMSYASLREELAELNAIHKRQRAVDAKTVCCAVITCIGFVSRYLQATFFGVLPRHHHRIMPVQTGSPSAATVESTRRWG
jgi:hypothetical protein